MYYPDWGEEGDFTMEFEWEPIVFAINDGVDSVVALLNPEVYAASPERAVYTVEGTYTFADGGESRYARLYFSSGVLQQVFGYTGEGGTGATAGASDTGGGGRGGASCPGMAPTGPISPSLCGVETGAATNADTAWAGVGQMGDGVQLVDVSETIFEGVSPSNLGSPVAVAGDLDGDGYDDIVLPNSDHREVDWSGPGSHLLVDYGFLLHLVRNI